MTEVKMPLTQYVNVGLEPLYTAAQLKQYGDNRAREALEMAADTCDSTMYIECDGTISKYGPMTYANVEMQKCADAIRALAKEIK